MVSDKLIIKARSVALVDSALYGLQSFCCSYFIITQLNMPQTKN